MTMTVKTVIHANNKILTIFIFTRSGKDPNFQGKQLLQVFLSTDNREWYIFGRKHLKKKLLKRCNIRYPEKKTGIV